MDLSRINKKLREAGFFLGKMHERAQMAFGDHEEMDFYLSAFLNAARSVDYRLRHEQQAVYSSFYKGWEAILSPDESGLLKFMVDDRNLEVHESGSGRLEQEKHIPVKGSYRDKSGTIEVTGPVGTPPTMVVKPTYVFVINGGQEPVTTVCQKYVALLDRLVADFSRSQGIP